MSRLKPAKRQILYKYLQSEIYGSTVCSGAHFCARYVCQKIYISLIAYMNCWWMFAIMWKIWALSHFPIFGGSRLRSWIHFHSRDFALFVEIARTISHAEETISGNVPGKCARQLLNNFQVHVNRTRWRSLSELSPEQESYLILLTVFKFV